MKELLLLWVDCKERMFRREKDIANVKSQWMVVYRLLWQCIFDIFNSPVRRREDDNDFVSIHVGPSTLCAH